MTYDVGVRTSGRAKLDVQNLYVRCTTDILGDHDIWTVSRAEGKREAA